MKKQIFLLALVLLLPSAVAFNCNSLSGGDFYVCNSIQSTDLSQTDKDLLISDIFNKNKTYPDFDFVYSWNTNLAILNPSDGKTYSSGTIKNAWIEIIALMPSIIENDALYSANTGKLRTEYSYQYVLPSGTEYGDCRTDYSLSSNNANLNIFVNDYYIGSQKLNSFNIIQDYDNLNFKSELDINVKYEVDHYRWKWVDDNRICRYYSAETRTDNLKLSDSLNAKLYKSQLNSSFKITDKYYNITKGVLEADNFTNLILSFNNSKYQDSEYIYTLSYALPYYILTLKAEKRENINFNNIHVDKNNNNFYFNIKDASNCKIQLFDYFNSLTKNCDLDFNEAEFSIKTDKTNYYENETIKVYIFPSDITINLTYAGENKLAENYAEFNSVLYENRIQAKLNDQEVSRLINVNKKENTIIFYNLSVLSFLGYIFYKAAKIYYLGLGV